MRAREIVRLKTTIDWMNRQLADFVLKNVQTAVGGSGLFGGLHSWVRELEGVWVSYLLAKRVLSQRERERERDRNWQRKREKEREIFCFERACIDCQRKREKERESQQNLDSKFNETWTIFANKDLDNICKQSLDSRPLTLCVNICWQNLESLYLLGKHLFNR